MSESTLTLEGRESEEQLVYNRPRKGYGWSKIPGKNADMRLPKRGKKNVIMEFRVDGKRNGETCLTGARISFIKKEVMPSASSEKETFSRRDLRKNNGNQK